MKAKARVCGICGQPFEEGMMKTIDHIHPLSRGGAWALSNLQVAHVWCNRKKGSAVCA